MVIQPGKWDNELTFLLSDKPEASDYLKSAALEDVDKGFPISTYLSPAGVSQVGPAVILHNDKPLDGALVASLMLNEGCRTTGIDVVYHLPLRQDQWIGHACDLVFNLKAWNCDQKGEWNSATWAQRLQWYRIDQACGGALQTSALFTLNGAC